ncbi:MAG: hypothetical protein AAGU11_19870 [Syntrophobacteraceae bacterium]
MNIHSILAVFAVTFFLAAPGYAQMKPLSDHQLDLITAGASLSNSSSGSVSGHGGVVDNSNNIDGSSHSLAISSSNVDIRSVTSTVGSSNSVLGGTNAMAVIGRPQGSTGPTDTPRIICQSNVYY